MKPPERLDLPMTVSTPDGEEHEVARLVYVLERTCENLSSEKGTFACSECHDVWRKPAVDLMNYCPNCGAKVVEQ